MTEKKMLVLNMALEENPSIIQDYINYHANVWPEVIDDLRKRPVGRMRIYNSENKLVMLLEVDKDFDIKDVIHIEPPIPKVKEWSTIMSKLGKKLESGKLDSWTEMNMVFDTNEY